jgi:hypothetical protein
VKARKAAVTFTLRSGALYQGPTLEAAEKSLVVLNLLSCWFIFLFLPRILGRFY